MTDLIRNYCYPLEQQKAAGHPSSNFSLFLKTGKLSHLCASSYTSVLPAAAPKSLDGPKKLKASAAESKQQLPVTPIIFANKQDELYDIKNIDGPALKTEVLSTFFVNPQTEGDSTGEVITLYKSRTIHGAATFSVDDVGFEIYMSVSSNLFPGFKGNLEQIRGGTICKKETITFITLLCERLWLDAPYVDIIHLQISDEIIDFKKEIHGKIGVAINGVISCLFPKEIKCFYMKKNEVHITKINYNQLTEIDEKTIPCVGITSFARSKIGQNNPCVIYGDVKGDIYKLDFAPKKEFKVNIKLQENSGSILHICCGHPKNITYKEFYYATEKYLYFDTYNNESTDLEIKNRSQPIRKVPIPQNWKIKQLMCTQNEERIIALLSSSKKDGNSQTEIMIIPNLKPGQSATARAENWRINQRRYYFWNRRDSWNDMIITVLDNEKLRLCIDGYTKNDFSLNLKIMDNNFFTEKTIKKQKSVLETDFWLTQEETRSGSHPKLTLPYNFFNPEDFPKIPEFTTTDPSDSKLKSKLNKWRYHDPEEYAEVWDDGVKYDVVILFRFLLIRNIIRGNRPLLLDSGAKEIKLSDLTEETRREFADVIKVVGTKNQIWTKKQKKQMNNELLALYNQKKDNSTILKRMSNTEDDESTDEDSDDESTDEDSDDESIDQSSDYESTDQKSDDDEITTERITEKIKKKLKTDKGQTQLKNALSGKGGDIGFIELFYLHSDDEDDDDDDDYKFAKNWTVEEMKDFMTKIDKKVQDNKLKKYKLRKKYAHIVENVSDKEDDKRGSAVVQTGENITTENIEERRQAIYDQIQTLEKEEQQDTAYKLIRESEKIELDENGNYYIDFNILTPATIKILEDFLLSVSFKK